MACGYYSDAGHETGREGGHGGNAVGQGHEAGFLRDLIGFISHDADPFAGFLKLLPVDETAELPIGNILLGDGPAIEIESEDHFHFFEGIEPVDEARGLLAVIETVIEFIADVAGETGDFAFAGHWFIGLSSY